MTLPMLSKMQLAYTAGIIDGEGCIRFNRNRSKTPIVRVHVTNTDAVLVETLREWFGGYVWSEGKAYMPNAKRRYIWEVSAIKAEKFLMQIKPFLLLKRKQAELALEMRTTFVRRGRTPVSVEMLAMRERLVAEITVLNKKGTHHASA